MALPPVCMHLQTRRNLLKPLRVHFIGEDGIDAGQ
jgi:hypothetical protein